MNERTRLADAIERTVSGPVWHGVPLAELLSVVSSDDSLAHPIAMAHSIREIVLHVSAWARIAQARLHEANLPEPTDAEDWPAIVDPTSAGWNGALAELTAAHSRLAAAVLCCDPSTLERQLSNPVHTVRTMLLGIPEHGAYHGGQIALLTRGLGKRPTFVGTVTIRVRMFSSFEAA